MTSPLSSFSEPLLQQHRQDALLDCHQQEARRPVGPSSSRRITFSELTRLLTVALFLFSGFAFKKDTGDTRESASINLIHNFLAENANVSVYDPQVEESQIWMDLAERKGTDIDACSSARTAFCLSRDADGVSSSAHAQTRRR